MKAATKGGIDRYAEDHCPKEESNATYKSLP